MTPATARDTTFSGPMSPPVAARYAHALASSSVTISPPIKLRMMIASVCSSLSPSRRAGWITSRRYSANATAAMTSAANASCENE